MKVEASRNGKLIGSEVEASLLKSDVAYADVVAREFSVITAQNEMKFGWVSKQEGVYDFSDADAIVAFAQKHGMKVRGHTLIWHRNLPKWLSDQHPSGAALKKILVAHVS